jgi:hypothetical protein
MERQNNPPGHLHIRHGKHSSKMIASWMNFAGWIVHCQYMLFGGDEFRRGS